MPVNCIENSQMNGICMGVERMSMEDTVKIMLQDVQIGDYANAIHNHCKKIAL